MRLARFMRASHKWLGVILALGFLLISITGFLLLEKKQFSWIQPPTLRGAPGDTADLITMQDVLEAALGAGHPDFQRIEDIDRVDFRPGKRVHKVQSVHNYTELQIDAMTGAVLGTGVRRSDFLENLHDGSLFGDTFHGIIMPACSIGLLLLVVSGIYMWLQPGLRKARRKQQARR